MKLISTIIILLLGFSCTISESTTKFYVGEEPPEIIPAPSQPNREHPVVTSANVPMGSSEHLLNETDRSHDPTSEPNDLSAHVMSTSNGPLVPNTSTPEETWVTIVSTPQEITDGSETQANQNGSSNTEIPTNYTLSPLTESTQGEKSLSTNYTMSPSTESTHGEKSWSVNTENPVESFTSGIPSSSMSTTHIVLLDDKMELDVFTSNGETITDSSTTNAPLSIDGSQTNSSNQTLPSKNELQNMSTKYTGTPSGQDISTRGLFPDHSSTKSFTSKPALNETSGLSSSSMEKTNEHKTSAYSHTIRSSATVTPNAGEFTTYSHTNRTTTSTDYSALGSTSTSSSQISTSRNDDLDQHTLVPKEPSDAIEFLTNTHTPDTTAISEDKSGQVTMVSNNHLYTSTSPVHISSNPTKATPIPSASSSAVDRTSIDNFSDSSLSSDRVDDVTKSPDKLEKSEISTKTDPLDPPEQISELRSNPADLQPLWPPVPTASSVMPKLGDVMDKYTTAALDQGLLPNSIDFYEHNSI